MTRNRTAVSTLAMAALLAAGSHLGAQTPAAKAGSATPNLAGVWLGRPADQYSSSKEALPMKPDAEEAFKYNTVNWRLPSGPGRKELDPFIVSCAPPGVPRAWLINLPFEMIQRPNRIVVIYEADHPFRQIWLDGRAHPDDFGKDWTGHSTGRWEGDTLVVDTVGLNGEPWLDSSGHIYSNEVRLTERIRRADRNTLSIDDPKSFTKPWTGQRIATLQPGRVIKENLACGGIMNG